ncbi:hypothetical protein Q31a_18200 [Aureliella helgolandensis]|uniref:Uncharacterized protein n=1 Tax=Aureliella helgolandensis TaxID=2527968 RepID=A0A518G4P3_9BACT|nr:hypothetical protein Q31a_18200 [Aureliella helgolandensis]
MHWLLPMGPRWFELGWSACSATILAYAAGYESLLTDAPDYNRNPPREQGKVVGATGLFWMLPFQQD